MFFLHVKVYIQILGTWVNGIQMWPGIEGLEIERLLYCCAGFHYTDILQHIELEMFFVLFHFLSGFPHLLDIF